MPQIWHHIQQLLEKCSEKLSELRKSPTFVTILVACLIFIPIFTMFKNSKFHIFEPYRNPCSSGENAWNITANHFKGIAQNVTESVRVAQNSSSSGENAHNITADHFKGIAQNVTESVGVPQNSSSSKHPSTSSKPVDQMPLDDLPLASGFDKDSCLSRYQSSSYRKARPYKPSPYLISRLRSYEELHTRCGPHSVSYRRTIRKLSRSTHINETTSCTYLVWTPVNGLGNRMVSIASAFLYALLKNRVLLLEFEAEMNDLFCEPFPNSSWLLPKNFPHKHHWSQLPSFKSGSYTGDNECCPSFLHLVLQHGNGDPNIKHFHCNDTQSLLNKVPALIVRSDQYFVPSLFLMSSFKEELNKMFPEKATIFHHLGHYLFHPSNEAWGLITRFYQAYLSNSDEKIGIQIRLFRPDQVRSKTITAQILSCILKHKILPSLDTNVSLIFPSGNQTSKSKAVLVVSLHPEYAEELRAMYWTRPTVTGDVVGVYQPSHEEYQKYGDNKHNIKAWAEIYLLSLCDVLVTSPQSTFGYVAHSLGGIKPWIMDGLGSTKVQDPPCKRGLSMEPCFHIPPKYDCKGKTKIDNISAISPFLMPCEDLWWGIKLG